jgi:hypothetical protein
MRECRYFGDRQGPGKLIGASRQNSEPGRYPGRGTKETPAPYGGRPTGDHIARP